MLPESKRSAAAIKAACGRGRYGAAVILFVPLLLIIALVLRIDRKDAAAAPQVFADPAECVTAFILAEQAGDRDAQLGCFAGPLFDGRQSDSAKTSSTPDGHRPTGKLAGFAITELDYAGPNAATLVLERVYRQGSQRDRVRLRKADDGWKIVELTALGQFAQPIPYGTPVSATAGSP